MAGPLSEDNRIAAFFLNVHGPGAPRRPVKAGGFKSHGKGGRLGVRR